MPTRVTINPTTGEVSFDVDTIDDAVALAQRIKIEPSPSREGEEPPDGELSACDSYATAELTGAQYEAWAYLVANENLVHGVTISAVARHLKVNNSTAGARLAKLVSMGYAERVSMGRYRPLCGV